MKKVFSPSIWSIAFLLVLSCSGVAPDSFSFTLENKGLTADAGLTNEGQILLCGESAVFNSDKDPSNKDAFVYQFTPESGSAVGYSFGVAGIPDRCERMFVSNKDIYIRGYSGEEKESFIMKMNTGGTFEWGQKASGHQSTDQSEMAVNAKGEVLIATKNLSAEAYDMDVHLFDSKGQYLWSRRLKSVEVLQDIDALKDGNFLISFKQKGAYLDGQTRKRYLMNTFDLMDTQGNMVSSIKFHFDDDQVHGVVFSEVLEDANAHLYFLGRLELQKGNEGHIYILKANSDGSLVYSKFVANGPDFRIRSAVFTPKGNLLILADGYGRKGGLLYFEMSPDGKILWSRQVASAQYDQAIRVLGTGKGSWIVWDRLFRFSAFHIDPQGKSCLSDESFPEMELQDLAVQTDHFKGQAELDTVKWEKLSFDIKRHDFPQLKSDCK